MPACFISFTLRLHISWSTLHRGSGILTIDHGCSFTGMIFIFLVTRLQPDQITWCQNLGILHPLLRAAQAPIWPDHAFSPHKGNLVTGHSQSLRQIVLGRLNEVLQDGTRGDRRCHLGFFFLRELVRLAGSQFQRSPSVSGSWLASKAEQGDTNKQQT